MKFVDNQLSVHYSSREEEAGKQTEPLLKRRQYIHARFVSWLLALMPTYVEKAKITISGDSSITIFMHACP